MKYQLRSFFIAFVCVVAYLTLLDFITHNPEMYQVSWKWHLTGEERGSFRLGDIYVNVIIGTCLGIFVNIGHNICRALDKILYRIGGQ